MKKEIHKAVANLPEELITPEIAAAAIAEGSVELLDYLPHKYLTGDVIVSIISKGEGSYRWGSFDLNRIPEKLRTQAVCEFAVKKEVSNILAVPQELLSQVMLRKLLGRRTIKYLHLFPKSVWSVALAIEGADDVYSETKAQYGSRGGYHGHSTTTDIKPVQIFLSFVPQEVKTREFYLALFDKNISAESINIITPKRYKNLAYYIKMGAKDFTLVPEKFYCYEVFWAALNNKQISLEMPYSYGQSVQQSKDAALKHNQLTDAIFSMMDSAMADMIINIKPSAFSKLPKKFQTSKRLVTAIEKGENRYNYYIVDSSYSHLFTKDVCQAFVRKNNVIPELPETIWTQDFVDYCMEHGTSFYWFKQMPKHFQTPQIVFTVLSYSGSHLDDVLPELVSLEQAQTLYRDRECFRKMIPQHFIREFVSETGLNERFFGGEVSLVQLREDKSDYTYCKVGHCYIGIYREKDYSNSPYILTMTRRTPKSFRPEPVFDRELGTFHTTWLEKMIADYDSTFIKPSVPKELKEYQVNGYYLVENIQSYKGINIYANSIFGQRVLYTAKVGDIVFQRETVNELKEQIDESEVKTAGVIPQTYSANIQPIAS